MMKKKEDFDFRKNRENYRKNLGGRSNDSMGCPEEIETDEEGDSGRLFYQELYVIGRPPKNKRGPKGTPSNDARGEARKERRGGGSQRGREKGDGSADYFDPTRILSSQEFLAEYEKGRFTGGKKPRPSNGSEETREGGRNAENQLSKRERKGRRGAESRKPSETKTSAEPRRGKNVGSQPGDRGKTTGLRIIGGTFRALRLEYSGDHRVRPMKDRIREAVFNLMGTVFTGKHVIDLFAGTGALAFEALSRGAESATLIEVHFPTARVTRENIARLEEQKPGISDLIDLITTDVFFWGRNLARILADEAKKTPESADGSAPFSSPPKTPKIGPAGLKWGNRPPADRPWIVFCSPPYDFYVERQEELLHLIQTVREAAPPESVFVIEADERFDFDLLGVPISPKKRRSYPPAEVGIFTV